MGIWIQLQTHVAPRESLYPSPYSPNMCPAPLPGLLWMWVCRLRPEAQVCSLQSQEVSWPPPHQQCQECAYSAWDLNTLPGKLFISTNPSCGLEGRGLGKEAVKVWNLGMAIPPSK